MLRNDFSYLPNTNLVTAKLMLHSKRIWSREFSAPDRPLAQTPEGVQIPDTDAPHTQLGTRESKRGKGKYPQAREFDKDGKPVRDIDFTDHRKPENHTNPHQRKWDENPTGGSRSRGDPEPMPEWRYK